MKIHKVDEETVLLELRPTKYYQLWNILDLQNLLLSHNNMTFKIEESSLKKQELLQLANQMKKYYGI